MTYYNHYNLEEIEEEMNAPTEVCQMQFMELPILIQDVSRTQLRIISDGLLEHKSVILQGIREIYSVGRIQFRKPHELSIFIEFPSHDFLYFHNKILAVIDYASYPNFQGSNEKSEFI